MLNKHNIINNPKILLMATLIIILAIPLTIKEVQRQQEIRQRAAEAPKPPPPKVSIQLVPSAITKKPDDAFSINIELKNDNRLDISGVAMNIIYSDNILELSNFEDFDSPFAQIGPAIINERSLGTMRYATVNIKKPEQKKINDGIITLGTLTFKGKNPSTDSVVGKINFTNIQIVASTVDDALTVDPILGGNYTIVPKSSLIPTSTPVPTSPPTPTPTPLPGSTVIDLSLMLEAIEPKRTLESKIAVTPVTIEAFRNTDTENQVSTKQGVVIYNPVNGKFEGKVDIGILPKGNYMVKIKIPRYLKKLVQNIFSVKDGTEIQTVPISTTLLRGSINEDEIIDVRDYSAILDCYGNKLPLCKNKDSADLDFDGSVGIIDLNIILRNYGKTDD